MGAFAALLGLSLAIDDSDARQVGKFDAIAVGDSCIFQVRGTKMISRFPLQTSDQFNSRPVLLSSLPSNNDLALQAVQVQEGEWRTDDRFLLMTDALACWFLRECEQGKTPWQQLCAFGINDGTEPFADWIAGLRANGSLKNDDVTLLRIVM